jgi:aspartate-semialdehyde dehydrogenase
MEFEEEMTAKRAPVDPAFRSAPGVMVVDNRENGGYITPLECVGDYATFVSRIRDRSHRGARPRVVVRQSDNLRKGAALNAVQIAELLGRRHLKKG